MPKTSVADRALFDAAEFTVTTAVLQRGDTYRMTVTPFRDWLRSEMQRRGLTITDVANIVSRNEAAVRRVLGAKGDAPNSVSDITVEHYGLRIAGNPRLAAELYPELDY